MICKSSDILDKSLLEDAISSTDASCSSAAAEIVCDSSAIFMLIFWILFTELTESLVPTVILVIEFDKFINNLGVILNLHIAILKAKYYEGIRLLGV